MPCVVRKMSELVKIRDRVGTLGGELIPVAGARDVIVIFPGSGPTDRNGNSPGVGLRSNTYKMLAEALGRAGISSLRIDKRGIQSSKSALRTPFDATVDKYVSDARRWVAWTSRVAPRTWLAGHSIGGLVALLASRIPAKNLRGLVLMSTPGRRLGQLLIEQLRSNPANSPLIRKTYAILANLEAGRFCDPARIPAPLRSLFAAGNQPYWIDLLKYDPAAAAHDWRGPALILQGDADRQIKPYDADLLAAAMPQAIRMDLTGATHMLKTDISRDPSATYHDPRLPLHPEVVPSIVQFLEAMG